MIEKKRVAYYDNCKFFLIILVVVGHFIEEFTAQPGTFRSLFLFIYTFHMPLFCYLSGLFDAPGQPMSKRAHKGVYYIALYLLLKAVITVVRWILYGKMTFKLLTEEGIPWFCLVLGVFVILTGLLHKAKINIGVFLIISVITACFVGFDKNVGDYLCLSRIVIFYPFYLAGVLTPKAKLESLIKIKPLRIAALAVVGGYLACCFLLIDKLYILRHLFTGRNPFKESIISYGPALRLLCYALTTVVGLCVLLIMPQMDLGKLTEFGQRTMQVYFWHRPILYVLVYFRIHESVVSIGPAGKVLWILCAVALTLILSLKPFGFPTVQVGKWLKKA